MFEVDLSAMNRFANRLRRLARFAMAAVFGGASFFWIRSQWVGDSLAWSRPVDVFGVSSNDGYLYVFYGIRYMPNLDGDGLVYKHKSPEVWPTDRMSSPEWCLWGGAVWGTSFTEIAIETWKISIICALVLVRRPLALRETKLREQMAHRNSIRIGLCHKCGYDLRATPNRCPECGTIPPTRSA
jgi:hypothetical protein